MNYGVIPFAMADNKKDYQEYTVKFNEIGITEAQIIIVKKSEDITEQLKEGDVLVVLSDAKYCGRTKAVISMFEKILAKGITLYLYNQSLYMIQPDELQHLQKLVNCLEHKKQIVNTVVN